MSIHLSEKNIAFNHLSHRAQLHIKLAEARTDYQKLLEAITYNEPSLVKFYLDAGVSANSEAGSDTSPIFHAAVMENPLITKMLLGYGANPSFEHRMAHSTIVSSVFNSYDRLMQDASMLPLITDKRNNLIMIAAIIRNAGQRFDTPDSSNKSPLDKFGLWVGAERKEQVLAEFLEEIDRADINRIRVTDVVAQSPEEITRLSPQEEQSVSLYRRGRYGEILGHTHGRGLGMQYSRDDAVRLLRSNISSNRTTLESRASSYLPRPIDSLGLPIMDYTPPFERPRLREETHRMSGVTLYQSALSMQSALSDPVLLAQLIEVNRLLGHGVSSSPQQNQTPNILSSGPNAKTIEDLGFSPEEIPNEYICPLSLSIMSDPVHLLHDETGQRFERNWIATWLRDKGTHPTTRKPFGMTDIQSDVELKNGIDEFMHSVENTISYGRK